MFYVTYASKTWGFVNSKNEEEDFSVLTVTAGSLAHQRDNHPICFYSHGLNVEQDG